MKTLRGTVRRLVHEAIRQKEALALDSRAEANMESRKSKFMSQVTNWAQTVVAKYDALYRQAADEKEREYADAFILNIFGYIEAIEDDED